MAEIHYINNLSKYTRRQTVDVKCGQITIGSSAPISCQSMTNRDTNDINGCVDQIIAVANVGGDIVRLTTQGLREAESLKKIKEILTQKGINTPIVADVHFKSDVAKALAPFIEKVRINPGNFVGFKRKDKEYSAAEYQHELNVIEEHFVELINICKEHNTCLRVGSNHGSLSPRIVNKYGDTPLGMAESAMEFLRIAVRNDFTQIVVSMKSSNTRVMVYAYRLLVAKMNNEGMSFPIHLGVTEAGYGDEGRIKSAIGIGALLSDGIGDTIRVSLTEEPENEIPVAKVIVDNFSSKENSSEIIYNEGFQKNPYEYSKRNTIAVENIGGTNSPIVIVSANSNTEVEMLSELDPKPDYIMWQGAEEPKIESAIPLVGVSKNCIQILSAQQYINTSGLFNKLVFVEMEYSHLSNAVIEKLRLDANVVIILKSTHSNSFVEQRAFFFTLMANNITNPVVVNKQYNCTHSDFIVKSASDTGALFIDGLGDGIFIENVGSTSSVDVCQTAFTILQASRVRTTKTEYISCPGCGRTLFNLQETAEKVKAMTSHLKGLKIAVMGCIVNGPGEMADADYGYVGAGPNRVTLYKGQQVVTKNIPQNEAIEQLINIIKDNGDWQDVLSV